MAIEKVHSKNAIGGAPTNCRRQRRGEARPAQGS